jgi:hypothetical protein
MLFLNTIVQGIQVQDPDVSHATIDAICACTGSCYKIHKSEIVWSNGIVITAPKKSNQRDFEPKALIAPPGSI